ncbi:hypothetical protein HPB47_007866 [Ixodes persulcatus]|uniref:Uncharacterized protein n=1 Tax=Ixodes persulcatus TaxID=34615 RepID=A0AC60P6C0_IXOPE|nr:hypothetical protein HPB47_007866 [Ixodes persulcatus]
MVAVLAATDIINLDKLAETADRIADYSALTAVAAVSTPSTPSSSSLEARHARLEERLDEIVDTLAAMLTTNLPLGFYCCRHSPGHSWSRLPHLLQLGRKFALSSSHR